MGDDAVKAMQVELGTDAVLVLTVDETAVSGAHGTPSAFSLLRARGRSGLRSGIADRMYFPAVDVTVQTEFLFTSRKLKLQHIRVHAPNPR